MSNAIRYPLAAIAGIVTAFLFVMGIEAAGHTLYPPPAGLDVSNPAAIREYMKVIPPGALLFVLASWLVAPFAGGVVAARIAGSRPMLFAGLVGALVLAATVANLVMIPHPAWMAVAAVAGIPTMAVLAARTGARRAP